MHKQGRAETSKREPSPRSQKARGEAGGRRTNQSSGNERSGPRRHNGNDVRDGKAWQMADRIGRVVAETKKVQDGRHNAKWELRMCGQCSEWEARLTTVGRVEEGGELTVDDDQCIMGTIERGNGRWR